MFGQEGEGAIGAGGGELTSISRKFSGGPYISSKLCWRASGIACMMEARGGEHDVGESGSDEGGAQVAARIIDDGGSSLVQMRVSN